VSGYYEVVNDNAQSEGESWNISGGVGATAPGDTLQTWNYGGTGNTNALFAGGPQKRSCPARSRENGRVTIATETLTEIALDGSVAVLGANDAARSSFTIRAGDSLVALSADLVVLGQWPVDPQHRGNHATHPDLGLALISGADQVSLLDGTGRARWRYPHPPWDWKRGFRSGCTWFDRAGQSYAVVPAASYDHCLVVCLDLHSGRPLAETPIRAKPEGIIPLHHPDGWVGLSEGEGQDAARSWWVRSTAEPSGQRFIEVIDAGWGDWVLSDVDPTGSLIITTPHLGGPLLVRSFPSLEMPPAEPGCQSPKAGSSAAE